MAASLNIRSLNQKNTGRLLSLATYTTELPQKVEASQYIVSRMKLTASRTFLPIPRSEPNNGLFHSKPPTFLNVETPGTSLSRENISLWKATSVG